MSDLCAVLGNGPSLKGFDLHRLDGVASLGMNAAYRYWDEIDWYPTYYACLDDQLILSHHDEIYRLWKQGRIEKFFLHSGFFEFHPDCIGAPEFHSLDQVLPHWYRKRGKGQGWEDLTGHPAFKTQDTTKITTGAFATRFCAYMGHTTLALMGIDLKYVEILPEAEKTEGVGLVMKETPKSNPNYFFDSYQQAGDKYNIPNPDVHSNELHIQSFRLIPKDFALNGLNVTIYNTNPNSLLEDEKVFPLRPIGEVLIPHKLGAVVVPTTQFEYEAVLANFDIWAEPGFEPLWNEDTDNRCALVFMFNNDESKKYEARIREKFAATGMSRFFSYLGFEYLGLEAEDDLYERDYSKKVGEQGYKSGPNNQFFRTMRASRDLGQYVFQMETDCVPMRRGWLSALRRIVAAERPFWILGSVYHGVEVISPMFRNHLNGNAVYAAGKADFQAFLDEFWEPRTRRMVADVDRRLAYDCVLEKIFTEQRDSDPEVQALLGEHGDKFRSFEYLLNISGKRDLAELIPTYRRDLLKRFPSAHILHNRTAQQRTVEEVAMRKQKRGGEESGKFRRLVVFDMTAMGDGTATGEVKATLFGAWPADRILQVARQGKGLALVRKTSAGGWQKSEASAAEARAAIAEFAPEALLYRPVPNVPQLHEFAMEVIRGSDLPLASWLMDDWPAEVERTDPEQWAKLGPDLAEVIERSSQCLSICDAMSDAFGVRYGKPFRAFANGIDPDQWPSPKPHHGQRLLLRYAGGLAANMTRSSVLRLARAVHALAEAGHDIHFEINTQNWWYEQSKDLFAGLTNTTISTENRSTERYRAWLNEADVVVIAYNYDAETLRYVRYSMANKLPECLASQAVLFVHGPAEIATVGSMLGTGAAEVVTEDSDLAVQEALLGLLKDPARRSKLSKAGYERACQYHNIHDLRRSLRDVLGNMRAVSRSGDFLMQLAAQSGKEELLLKYTATKLMLEPREMTVRLNSTPSLRNALKAAVQSRPETDRTRIFYQDVLRHVAETPEFCFK